MAELKVGMKLFHKNNKMGIVRECELIKIYAENGDEKIDVKFFEKISVTGETEERDVFKLPTTSIGEFLFFEEKDAQLSTEELANMLDYIEYGNSEIVKIIEKREEERKRQEKILYLKQEVREREIQNITEVLEERNIKHLVYFTRIENLKSILQNGIVPENCHSEKGIYAVNNNCKKRYHFQVEGNGYSVEFPNYKLLNLLREEINIKAKYVILRLNAKSVLIDTIGKHTYCEDNALTSAMKYSGMGLKALLTTPVFKNEKYGQGSLKELFSQRYFKEGYEYDGEYQKEIDNNRDDLDIPDHYTTNPQAEIVSGDIVSPKYIKQVIFENDIDKQLWLENNVEFQNSSVNFAVDESFFGPRNDYPYWQ